MTLAFLDERCFEYSIKIDPYLPIISSFTIFIALVIISIGVFILKRKTSSYALNNPKEENYKLPGRDFLQLEKSYSHPHEVFVSFSVRASKSPLIRGLVILICLALVLFPVQLSL